ncbi:MAG: hypothetical protein QM534_15850 [Sediminibacterium sp.]|nr:hypothetical protein [Sediminibacterium sp.]
MLRNLCKTRTRRIISFYLLITLLAEIIYPTAALALTSGPSTPEVQSFEPVSSSDMVDVFSGDFKYNIPLLDVGGYPINIAYNSGIGTDQEASWVGLGWNLNPGNISRAMRGLPDDFDGTDIVKKEFNMKPNRTFGINAGVGFEVFGFEKNSKPGTKKTLGFKPRAAVSVNYNTYKGFGVETSYGIGISAGVSGKGSLDAGLGLHASATGGLDIAPNVSFKAESAKKINENHDYLVRRGGASIGGSFNTRAGLKQLDFSATLSSSIEKRGYVPAVNSGGQVVGMEYMSSNLASKGLGSGGSVNFGLQTYVPHISMPMINNSISLNVKTGVQFYGVDLALTLGGYYSSQKLAQNSMDMNAYGYMYADKGQADISALMDFNREKDGSFSRFTKNLPVTNFTYDLYSASGQGIGGTFRPFRHDVGHVFDNYSSGTSSSTSLGLELGAGALLKAGADFTQVFVNNTSGKWTQKNKALKPFSFQGKSGSAKADEPYYFRAVGEKIADQANMGIYNQLGGDKAKAIRLSQTGSNSANITAENDLISDPNAASGSGAVSQYLHTNRQARNQNFSVLNLEEAKTFALQKNYYNGTGVANLKNQNLSKVYTGTTQQPNKHHIGEITVLNTQGQRYIYGLPAYNMVQKDVNFNISGSSFDCTSGLVDYTPNDASINNNRGRDNHFSATSVPPYAYSYLLTAIVSDDYVDVSGDGPTDDDLGTYTKFHYKKITGSGQSNYQWKMPATTGGGKANYSEGSKSDLRDQMASYSYGSKELWYLDEIETKNHIAVFETSNRSDGQGVSSEHGGTTNVVPQQKLDKIILYSKPEYKAAIANAATPAVPIKTVYFTYDYSLCPGTYNSTAGGKLTLKSVYFTYGKSDRARFNTYTFTYGLNKPYSPKAYDRWGNYKPDPAASCGSDYGYGTNFLSNAEFPYTNQDKTIQDQNAEVWQLKGIGLPSGGDIAVTYESDDYAFVQNYPAGQMLEVVSSSKTQPTAPVSTAQWADEKLFTATGSPYENYSYLIVSGIDPSVNTTGAFRQYYMKDLLNGAKKMHFRFLVNLTKPSGTNANFYEYVSGYAEVEDAGYIGTNSNQAWIKVKNVGVKRQESANNQINPIALAAIQFARLNYAEAVWGSNFNPPTDVEDALKQLANSAFGSLKTMVTGFKNPNKTIADAEKCALFKPHKSMVRLYNGTGKKLGGGSRVKQLLLTDNWSSMTAAGGGSQDNATYGQIYTYTTLDETNRTISSGVASYEPMIGGEEISMRQPLWFGSNKWTILAPDDRYFTEGPYGESFYPSAGVGYSSVKVSSYVPANAPVEQRNGYKQYEYYTAKDYPTLTESTPIIPKQHRPPLGNLLKIFSRDFIYTSQGFVVKTNDMHGKPKAELDFAEGNPSPVKETRYYFKTKGGTYQTPSQRDNFNDASYNGNELDNVCKVIGNDGKVSDKTIGVDFDAVTDFRESETNTTHVGSQGNVANFLIGIIPGVFPTVWPRFNKEISRFRSATLSKVVNQYAILEKVVVRENGAQIETENLAFDAVTGDALVTRSKNAFGDDVYNLNYPSHWGYDLMGPAYKNQGIVFENVSGISGGFAPVSNASAYFTIGDEVGITPSTGTAFKAWVCGISGSAVSLIDDQGNAVSTSSGCAIKILRSGRRNLMAQPMAALSSLENPLPSNSTSPISISSSHKILNASGTSFSDQWQMPKGYVNVNAPNTCNCSISQTGTDLVNFIETLFNRKNNAIDFSVSPYYHCNSYAKNSSFYNNAFLNGGLIPCAVTSYTPGCSYGIYTPCPPYLYAANFNGGTFFGQLQANSSALWKTPNVPLIQSAGLPYANMLLSPGFNTPLAAPDYGNYNFAQNLLNLIPYSPNATPDIGTAHAVNWVGPGIASGSIFVNGTLLIGYLHSVVIDPLNGLSPNVNPSTACEVSMDFGPGAVNWTSTMETEFLKLAAASNPNYVDIVPDAVQTSCSGSELSATFKLFNSGNTLLYSWPIKLKTSCMNGFLTNCNGQTNNSICGKVENMRVNPFFAGLKGNWRAKTAYSYLTGRQQTQSGTLTNTDVRRDGYFTAFTPLYAPNSNGPWNMNIANWTFTSEVSKYNVLGLAVESKDPLGLYSSMLYGYNERLPIAQAANARLREIAYDGFEDYDFYPATCYREHHFNFMDALNQTQITRTNQESHTGQFSLKVQSGNTASITKKVSTVQQLAGTNTNYCNYLLKDYDFIYPFSPVSGTNASVTKDYVVSYWVKQSSSAGSPLPLNYVNAGLQVTNAQGVPFAIKDQKRSVIIDGWQREEYTFSIPGNYSGNMIFRLQNTSGTTAYFDDLRVHPHNSSMKAYVYHPVNLKYVAELDANNFATFYEYDAQGNLVRVKKETERGIMTVQESKTHIKK